MAPRVSTFPLFYHLQRGSADQDLRAMTARGVVPAWVKVFRWNHATEVKQATQGMSKTLLRIQEMSEMGRWIDEGFEGGRSFVRAIRTQAGDDWQHVDAIEFTNEQGTYDNAARLTQMNDAALGFVAECRAQGKLPVIHNCAVANPKPGILRLLAPSITEAIRAGGYFSTHCYGPQDLFDQAALYVECYVGQVEELRAAGVNLPYTRVMITEFSHDYLSSYRNAQGVNTSGPWRWLPITIDQIKAEFLEYARRLTARGVVAFMYNGWGYDVLAASTGNKAHLMRRIEETRAAMIVDKAIPHDLAWLLSNLNTEAFDAPDPFELFAAEPDLRGWYIDQVVTYNQSPPPPDPGPTPPPGSGRATVTAVGGLKVRLAPSASGTVIGNLPDGSVIQVISSAGGWSKLGLQAGGALLIAGTSDPDPHGYVGTAFLRFGG